jgi:hypothetical protein
MTRASGAVMAVVHVKAPAEIDPHLIEAELTRAICTNRKRPMSAELELVEEVRPRPRRGHGPRRHRYVAMLSLSGDELPDDLECRIGKVARKALRRRFGLEVTASVKLGINATDTGAYWCSVRGRPQRPT